MKRTSSGADPVMKPHSKGSPKLILTGVHGETPVTFPLVRGEILIGRLDSVDLVLEDRAVSRVHAKIVHEAGRCVIVDLESSTGTLVNGVEITRHVLAPGDVIEIASARMEYRE